MHNYGPASYGRELVASLAATNRVVHEHQRRARSAPER